MQNFKLVKKKDSEISSVLGERPPLISRLGGGTRPPVPPLSTPMGPTQPSVSVPVPPLPRWPPSSLHPPPPGGSRRAVWTSDRFRAVFTPRRALSDYGGYSSVDSTPSDNGGYSVRVPLRETRFTRINDANWTWT